MDLRQFFSNQMWWGKIICALLGFLVAGPAGAFVGVFIGNVFDRGLLQHLTNPLWSFHTEKRRSVKALFIQAIFSALGHIAKADGRVSEQEIKLTEQLMQDMKLSREQQKIAKNFFNEGKKDGFLLKPVLDSLYSVARDNPNLLKLFIDTQYKAAQLDGLSENKIHIMNTILSSMHYAPIHKQTRFTEDFYQQSNQRSQSNNSYQSSNSDYGASYRSENNQLDKAYTILQIQPSSNKQEVKRAYRRLISRNHPDKLIAQGMSTDKIKLANEKTQIIRKAYEQICASKGW